MAPRGLHEVFQLKHKFIPLEKQSKRKQREYHEARRKDWGELSPVTRQSPNPKAYQRKKPGQRYEYEPMSGFVKLLHSLFAFACLARKAASSEIKP